MPILVISRVEMAESRRCECSEVKKAHAIARLLTLRKDV